MDISRSLDETVGCALTGLAGDSSIVTDKQLIWFATEFRRGLIGRHSSVAMCCMICAPLASILSLEGVEAEIVETDLSDKDFKVKNHLWLRLSDGRALDPTADQFDLGLPPVYLGEPRPDIHATKGNAT